ncbi:MAG: cytochrome c oxidase assembly protein [candidate division NC10 bacterium]|nr:cytochrome c oxidase assembly protein [candidate division NC10 bacterium]
MSTPAGPPHPSWRAAACILFILGLSLLGPWRAATFQAPEAVAKRYLEAIYAHRYREAYSLVSEADRRFKSQEEFLREHRIPSEPLNLLILELAGKLVPLIDYQEVRTEVGGERASVKIKARLPNGPEIMEEILGELPLDLSEEQKADARKRFERMVRLDPVPRLDVEETFDLVRQRDGWKVFVNWEGAILVRFKGETKFDLPWAFFPVQREVRVKPGEVIQAAYRARNLSDKPVTAKAKEFIRPEAWEKHVELIQCFCFLETTLAPGEEKEFPLSFRIKDEVPAEAKRFELTYTFYPKEFFNQAWPTEDHHGRGGLHRHFEPMRKP